MHFVRTIPGSNANKFHTRHQESDCESIVSVTSEEIDRSETGDAQGKAEILE